MATSSNPTESSSSSSSSTPRESSSSSSSSSSSRAATPASGPVTVPDLSSESLATTPPDPIPLAGGRYAVLATSNPAGVLGLELQLPDGSTTAYIQNAVNNVGANMQFSQPASIWLLPPGTYQVVASGPFTVGSLMITPF